MFLPIGDQPNPPRTPYVNYALIAANVVVYVLVSLPFSFQPADPMDPRTEEYALALREALPPGVNVTAVVRQLSAYDLLVFEHGYRPNDPSIAALFSSMFLHGGLLHLLGNMLFLWIYGDNVEDHLGGLKYLFWYLAAGAAGTLFHGLFASDSPIPLVGASGAISGVLGFYFVWFPRNQVRVLFYFFFFVRVFMMPARWVLGFYLVVSNLLPFLATASASTGVAYGAHIGGFLAGAAAAFTLDRRAMSAAPGEYRRTGSRPEPVPDAREAIVSALRRGEFDVAARTYFQLPSSETRRLLAPEDAIALAGWLAKNGHARAALILYQRHIRDYPTGPLAAEAHAYAGLLQLHAFDEPTSAYQHLVEALDFEPSRGLEATIRSALSEIASRQKSRVRR